jgi:hypothetical protein
MNSVNSGVRSAGFLPERCVRMGSRIWNNGNDLSGLLLPFLIERKVVAARPGPTAFHGNRRVLPRIETPYCRRNRYYRSCFYWHGLAFPAAYPH